MLAWVFEQSGHPLAIRSLPDPVAAAGELVLRVRSCGVCGTDLHLTGDSPAIPPGTVLGHEIVGEVVQIGEGVTGWEVGDRACALPFIGCGACAACSVVNFRFPIPTRAPTAACASRGTRRAPPRRPWS